MCVCGAVVARSGVCGGVECPGYIFDSIVIPVSLPVVIVGALK